MSGARVPGHALIREGAPFAETGVLNRYDSQGHGKCTCGDLSPWLDSNAKRKAWHRQHKLDVVAKQPSPATQTISVSLGGRALSSIHAALAHLAAQPGHDPVLFLRVREDGRESWWGCRECDGGELAHQHDYTDNE